MASFDPTKENFGDNPLDWEIPDTESHAGTADEIQNANERLQVPVGEATLEIVGIADLEPRNVTVLVKDRPTSYTSYNGRLEFRSLRDPRQTTSDFITFPPEDPREHEAYWEGLATEDDGMTARKNARPGWHATKFAHLVQRLGWPFAKGAKLPPEAKKLKNWVGKRVKATIEAGQPNKNGKVYNQIKPFSYESAIGGGGSGGSGGAAQHSAPAPAAPASDGRAKRPSGVNRL